MTSLVGTPKGTSRRLSTGMALALVLMCFALVATAVVSRSVFERLPHLEDEFAYLYQARIFAGWRAWVPREEPAAVFWQPFVLQPDQPPADDPDGPPRRFGKYTPGWPLALAPGIWLGQPWIINAFLAMLSVGLVYRLGREIFDEAVGLVAALLLTISPMALLLNATLMSHTWAMFTAIVFVYAYWRTTRRGRGRYAWAVLGGVMLGAVVVTRPLTAMAMAVPVGLHALWELQAAFRGQTRRTWPVLRVLFVMGLSVLPMASLWPLFNHLTTGDWRTNTYTLLWEYDRLGFGPGHGNTPGGHTPAHGWRQARADVREWLRDLFGFTLHPALETFAREHWGYGAGIGLSGVPVAAGLIAGRRRGWIWLCFGGFAALVIANLYYWIGAVVRGAAVYSARYYYEATFGVCLVAGYGVVAWARALRGQRQHLVPAHADSGGFCGRLRLAWNRLWPGYVLVCIACGLSVAGYTPARLNEPLPGWPGGLYRYNKIGQHQLEAVSMMRAAYAQYADQPVLIIVVRSPVPGVRDNWRDYGAAMAETSPYLDSDIILARVFDPEEIEGFLRRFSGRLVLYQIGEQLHPSVEAAMADAQSPGAY